MKNRVVTVITISLLLITSAIWLWNLYSFTKIGTNVIDSSLNITVEKSVNLKIPEFSKYDRIYLLMNANQPISNIEVRPEDALISIPFDVEGSESERFLTMSQNGFFYVANSSSNLAHFLLNMQPQVPYFIKTIEGKIDFNTFKHKDAENNFVGVELKANEFTPAGFSQLLLLYPFEETIQPDFQVNGTIKLIKGKIAFVNIVLMSAHELYGFTILPFTTKPNSTISFKIDAGSKELIGREFLSENFMFIAFGIGLNDKQWSETPSAIIGIGDITLQNGGKSNLIKAQVLEAYDIDYRIYVFHKFKPTHTHIMLTVALATEVCSLSYLAFRLKKTSKKKILA